MKTPTKVSMVPVWVAAVFCAFLSLMKLFLPGGAGDPAFFSFLPMCFFFVAAVQMTLVKRVVQLEEALRARDELRGQTESGTSTV